MNNHQAKKFRKSIRKQSKEFAKQGYAAALFKTARQRDWVTIIAIVLFISLCVSVLFNVV